VNSKRVQDSTLTCKILDPNGHTAQTSSGITLSFTPGALTSTSMALTAPSSASYIGSDLGA